MSTAFHPQTDSATEQMNRSVGQIFRSAISADQTDWVDQTPFVEFTINSSINETTGFTPFKLNYMRLPHILPKIQFGGVVHKGIREFIESVVQNLNNMYDVIIACRVFQKVQADKHWNAEPDIKVGSKVFITTKDLALPKERAGKFLPKFIGPYLVLDTDLKVSIYRLDLPVKMKTWNIHPMFHVSRLRPYHPNDDMRFPGHDTVAPYNYGEPDDETGVESIDGHQWKGKSLKFHVKWVDGTDSWEAWSNVEECTALDEYLVLQGMDDPRKLAQWVMQSWGEYSTWEYSGVSST